jgi:hypothetical protein
MIDFFVSYNRADRLWATGLADWLDQEGFTTILQEQDFVAGSNFVSEMHHAIKASHRFIMVLSPDYLSAKFPEAEWTAVFASDPTNERRTLIPVRVRECRPDGLLKPIVYIDLVQLDEKRARSKFISEIKASLERKRKRALSAPPPLSPENKHGTIAQAAMGKNITQVAGDYHHYQSAPKQKIFITAPEGGVSPEQRKQIQTWIGNLAENTVGMPRDRAFGMWQNRFKNKFRLTKYEELLATQMPDAEAWYRQQMAISTRGLKTKAPDAWRNAHYGAIKQAMAKLGAEKESYYLQLTERLKMRKPFSSLTKLTKRDLDRVYNMVLRDVRELH